MFEDTFDALKQDQIQLLADPRTQRIVSTLNETDGLLPLEELAKQLLAEDIDFISTEEYERKLDRTVLSLHHDRLPQLDEADILDYDPEANVVTDTELSTAEVEWLDELTKALKTQLEPNDADEQAIGVIEGSETIVQYGRQLCDKATDELFCMYISADLLVDECIRRVKSANQRDVSVYMGSEDPVVRDLTRKHLPDSTIWEPQLDWMNTPTYPRVARLILADREKVMLAIIDEADEDGMSPVETALVGNGENNPLVVLVRELLGQRLDHLDFQHKNASIKPSSEL